MLDLFQEQTKPLTSYEKETLLPIIAKGLSMKVGKENQITNSQICTAMRNAGYSISDARLRKIINHIRVNGIVKCLMASSNGYYVATSKKEVEKYLESLRGRYNAIKSIHDTFMEQASQVILN